jgi:hypothetical protein
MTKLRWLPSTPTSSSWSAGGDRGTARPPGASARAGIPSEDDRALVLAVGPRMTLTGAGCHGQPS